MNSQKIKALWLYHPHEFSGEDLFITKRLLRNFVNDTDARITAVHVKGSDYNKALEALPVKYSPAFEKAYDDDQKNYISKFSKYISEDKILSHKSKSRSDDLSTAMAEIEREEPDFLITRSHGRSGLKRFFLGSFTENLISKTKMPLICISRKSYSRPLSDVFIPINLEDRSFDFLNQILNSPKFSFIKKVCLFTHTDFGYTNRYPLSYAEIYQSVDHLNYSEAIQTSAKEKLNQWVEILSSRYPTIDFRNISTGSYRSTENEIIDKSFLSDSGLIVFQKGASNFIPGYLGSTSKHVIRGSKLPVCIISRDVDKDETKQSEYPAYRNQVLQYK